MKKDNIIHHAQALLENTVELSPSEVVQKVQKFILYIQMRGWTKYLGVILEKYKLLYNEKNKIIEAFVTTARTLDPQERSSVVETILKKTLATSVELNEIIDERLLGGIKIKIVDRVYDGSVRNTLKQLQTTLTQ